MATAGSGDVLTGMIAACLAQGLAPFEAARWGVHAHGKAGDRAFKKARPFAMIASDIIRDL
jgi:NAD(P)H-hydrate epimerase